MTVRLGIAGASRGLQLARSSRAVSGCSIAAVFDPDSLRAELFVAEIEGARRVSTFDDLLSADVDAVVIASPIPDHLEQIKTVAACGKHILCEVTPCSTIDESMQLVRAVNSSGVIFMLAENYCYFSEVETVRRLHQDGRFGDIYYAECDHLIDVRALWRNEDGELTWRGRGGVGVYSTHGLGPLLTILDDRVVQVACETVPGGQFDQEVQFPTMHLFHLTTARGVKMRLRIDLASPRPPLGAFYGIQGTRGAYESWRGLGDLSKVWLHEEHGETSIRNWGAWHPLDSFRQRYLGDDWEPIPEISGCDRRMIADFVALLRGEIANPFDVCRGLDFHLPGMVGDVSAAQGGKPMEVPDPRQWSR